MWKAIAPLALTVTLMAAAAPPVSAHRGDRNRATKQHCKAKKQKQQVRRRVVSVPRRGTARVAGYRRAFYDTRYGDPWNTYYNSRHPVYGAYTPYHGRPVVRRVPVRRGVVGIERALLQRSDAIAARARRLYQARRLSRDHYLRTLEKLRDVRSDIARERSFSSGERYAYQRRLTQIDQTLSAWSRADCR